MSATCHITSQCKWCRCYSIVESKLTWSGCYSNPIRVNSARTSCLKLQSLIWPSALSLRCRWVYVCPTIIFYICLFCPSVTVRILADDILLTKETTPPSSLMPSTGSISFFISWEPHLRQTGHILLLARTLGSFLSHIFGSTLIPRSRSFSVLGTWVLIWISLILAMPPPSPQGCGRRLVWSNAFLGCRIA